MKCTICKIYNAIAWLNRKPVCKECYKLYKISNRNRWLMRHKWYVRRRLLGHYGNLQQAIKLK